MRPAGCSGCHGWDGGLDVMVEGDAVRVTDDDVLKRLAEVWATKWDGRWQLEARDGCFYHDDFPSQVFSVTPVKIYAHAKGDPFGQTRHQF